jgi:glycine/D-amino acid oxidase-like deaminating enzyme
MPLYGRNHFLFCLNKTLGLSMNSHYDVVIVGGGVSGCSTAYFLAAQADFAGSILVVERDPTYANAPSARASGGVRQQFSTPENIRIGLFGAHFVKHIGDYLTVDDEVPDVGFKERGYLLMTTPDMLPVMQQNNAAQRECGADIHFQSPRQLRERFPWLAVDGLAGGFLGLSNEGWLDPYSLLQAFRRKARSLGVDFAHDEALEIQLQGNRADAVVLRNGGRISAGTVVNTAGAGGAAAMAAQVGVDVPIERRKRCTFIFSCKDQLAAMPMMIFPQGIGCRPESGSFLVNIAPPPQRDPVVADDDFDIDYYLFEDIIWPALAERIPAFEAIRLERAWSCHYDYNTLDENAILGRIPQLENYYIAAGFSGHGLQQSPAVGRALSELITFGEYRTLDLSRFGYERILSGTALRETNCY